MENTEKGNDEKVVKVIQLGKKVLEFRKSGEFTLGEVVDSLGIPIDRLRVDLRINGQSTDTSSLLRHGDTITVLPPIKGAAACDIRVYYPGHDMGKIHLVIEQYQPISILIPTTPAV